jgi:hypothetical protein
MPTIRPSDRPILYTVLAEEPISDVTRVGDLTGVSEGLQVVSDADENAYLGALAPHADAFPPLPPAGTWLEANVLYRYGDGVVMVRQSHTRTEHEPSTVPALFLVWRAEAGSTLEWVAGEQVQVGTVRVYEGVTYRCVQAHQTQTDWTPDATPTLWAVVVEEPQEPGTPEWAVGVAYKVGDVVTYQGREYRCLQAHTSIVTWTPVAAVSLWVAL